MGNSKFRELKVAVVREELMALTNGELVDSLILNQFLYWLPRLSKGIDSYLQEEMRHNPNIEMELTEGWIYKSANDLADEIMIGASHKKRVQLSLSRLVENGWIDRRQNPNRNWDRTYQYRVNLVKIKSDLHNLGYELQGFAYIKDIPISQNDPSKVPEDSSNKSMGYDNTSANLLKYSIFPEAPLKVRNAPAIPEIKTENKKEGEKISLQNDVLEKPQEVKPKTTINDDYRPSEEVERHIQATVKCSDYEYKQALSAFIKHNAINGKTSDNWDVLFKGWCANRQWSQNKTVSKSNTPAEDTDYQTMIESSLKRRQNGFERDLFSELAKQISARDYIRYGLALVKVDYIVGDRVCLAHTSREGCRIISEKYYDIIKAIIQAKRPEITDILLTAKGCY